MLIVVLLFHLCPFRSSGNETDPLLKVRMVQGQVDEVTAIMHSNIEKVIERGDRIDSLQMKAGALP